MQQAHPIKANRGINLPLCLLVSLIWLIGTQAYAAELSPSEESLVPICGGLFALCGYEDRSDKGKSIAAIYEIAMPFSEGLAVVRTDGLYGYIDTTGRVIIPPIYEGAGPFRNGIAEIINEGKAGIISRNGNLLIEPQFDRAIPFSATVVLAQPDTPDFTPSGALGDYQSPSFTNRLSGLYHLKKGWLTPAEYTFRSFDRTASSYVWAAHGQQQKTAFGLMRADGTWQIPIGFEHVQPLNEGLAVVSTTVDQGVSKRRLWGAVSADGKLAIPLKYDWLSYWQDGYAIVKIGKEEGFLSVDDTLLGGRLFQNVKRATHGKTLTVQVDEVWYDLTENGRLTPVSERSFVQTARAHEPKSSLQTGDCNGGASYITQKGLWGLKAPDERILVEPRYLAITCFHQGVAWVPDMNKRQWCAVGPDGRHRKRPECIALYNGVLATHHTPERLHEDAFLSNVAWMRKYLSHKLDPSQPCAMIIGDGARGGSGSLCYEHSP